jgi:tetrathionate reductase subunit B
MSINTTDTSRRNFLVQAGSGALSLGNGAYLLAVPVAAHAAADASKRWGMLIDTSKCADGCNDCVSACQQENGWGAGSEDEQHSGTEQKAQWIRTVTVKDTQTGHESRLPMMCQHCETPPCADVCPTGASFKRPDGIVLVDKHRCIGCRYCMMACPYKARSFIHESLHDQKEHAPRGKGTVESCTLCVHRVDAGKQPACVEQCKHGAMVFGDINDANSEIAQQLKQYGGTQIRADFGLNQGVRYRGV